MERLLSTGPNLSSFFLMWSPEKKGFFFFRLPFCATLHLLTVSKADLTNSMMVEVKAKPMRM